MKIKKYSLRSILSVTLASTMMLQTGMQAFAAADDGTVDLSDCLEFVTLNVDDPSEYGESNVSFVNENGDEVLFDLIPADASLSSDKAIPAAYDLRDYGLVTSVKNQNPTGTCWAHSALAAAESALIKDGRATLSTDFSEAHLVWFSQGAYSTDVTDPLYGDGSNMFDLGTYAYDYGGSIYFSRSALGSWIGADYEANYANVATSPTLDEAYRYRSVFHLQNAYEFDKSDRNSIKNYLMSNGALTISYYYDSYYENYTTAGGTAYYNDDYTSTNHAVTLVGWDDNYSKNNFATTPAGNGAWLIKNSWGTWYGDNGYFWLSYYDTSINRISSMEMEPANNYGGIYQHASTYYGGVTNNVQGLGMSIIYTATSNDSLAAVSFQTNQASTPYTIGIYTGASYGNGASGTLVHSQSGTATYAGLHTIKLSKNVAITKGTNFRVCVFLNKVNSMAVCDDYLSRTGRNFVAVGTSMNSLTGWEDYKNYGGGDLHIKAYTASKAATKPTNVTVTPGECSVKVTWTGVEGAENYRVFSYVDGVVTRVATVTKTRATITGLEGGKEYGFFVTAYVNGAWTTYTKNDIVYATPLKASKPTNVTVTPGECSVKVTWTGVEGAENYRVFSYVDGVATRVATVAKCRATITGLEGGKEYGFYVTAYVNGAWTTITKADIVYATTLKASKPTNVTVTPGECSVKVTWTGVEGAENYRVFSYVDGVATRVATVAKCRATITGLEGGKEYGFYVTAYVNGAWTTITKADIVYATTLKATKPTNVVATPREGGVKVTWTGVDGAENYRVFSYVDGVATRVATVASCRATITGLESGKEYGFFVRAYVNGAWTTFTDADIVYATPL